ncbi:hypothetical protein T492DRAFT_945116 [Pavlovales sp. CCMP2436]|nr:hypothetical protein T492DRAFT_945116 [Pavlovales sp. CCMP2436]
MATMLFAVALATLRFHGKAGLAHEIWVAAQVPVDPATQREFERALYKAASKSARGQKDERESHERFKRASRRLSLFNQRLKERHDVSP